MTAATRFSVGELVHHRKFGYRGVIVGVDPVFAGSDEWYEAVARSRPPRDQPWYHVLVDGDTHSTYVAERHLEADTSGVQIEHPDLGRYFDRFVNGRYGRGTGSRIH
ncbi:hemimethylated DNA binding protein [Thioalkalivibrio nitratireducens DSM 14787]|uniref:Heat shock protein HspQ n=1 Tax=Thioalkalivibrio nitratireducens (strain DSM 14787 / UNIQEM 213 / ALEN2) TaxID=1255043 RepID=L0E0E7_THIND|nr:heat shock protein HspQ [Thioalkalivibrio nitratireducens]AGA34685.1 hemimethylated DNA binding protein [Thioalkalivibrio nitratireducens DSM 14787]